MSVRQLSPELAAKAKEELFEVPERVPEDVQHIKDWLKKQPHLKARTDDQWLLAFLRGCKFSLERTKEKLDMFYTMRTICPEFFKGRDPFKREIQDVLNLGHFLLLPKADDPAAPRFVFSRSACFDPKKVDMADIFKCNMMMVEILLMEDDNFVIAGEQAFQDMEGTTMAHLMISPALMKKMSTIFQECYPIRIKGMHFYNIPSFFETVYNIFKPFLKEKNLKRSVIYTSDMKDKIHDVIPKAILPKEYGGEGPTIADLTAQWKKKVESYSEWFKEDEQYCTIERLRPGKPKTVDNVFGLEGSFRKLAVD